MLVLRPDELFQQSLGRVRGGGVPAGGAPQAPGEEVAQGVHPHGALNVLVLDRPAYGGLVDPDASGHISQGHGGQVAGAFAEKGLLELQNAGGAGHEGTSPLLKKRLRFLYVIR